MWEHLALTAMGSLATLLGFLTATWVITGRFPKRRTQAPTHASGALSGLSLGNNPMEDALRMQTETEWLRKELRKPSFTVEPPRVDPRKDVPMPDFQQDAIKKLEDKYKAK